MSDSPKDFLLVGDDCFFPDQLFSDLQEGPSVAEMMVCLGPAEITHRFQRLLQVCETLSRASAG